MKRAMSRSSGRLAAAALLGAAASYLLDPDRGRARRARARDQLLARARRTERNVQATMTRRARYTAGRMRGLRHRITPALRVRPRLDDATLADKIRSEVLGKRAFGDCPVTIDCVAGVVHVRGEVGSTERREALLDAIARVAGVHAVESHLHPPGEPAPNKAAALTATARLS